ncbi:lactose/L-arabinose transport system permease protein [Paenibacillus shirakamiensis]|uniref:Lactose/L-arabinose transport system permease protein n=1 Tax=Paenibacillus shirakamiensis TaxID=1265935 RepID=A0ABS4JEG5_9BACL|nr:carbohydrate ABC transporter permease [Paenibacillus shirakamiensis]MBP2000109.1 lactose/L-arabinose transport system permease protein [Paenibacillus shirakamiensis]
MKKITPIMVHTFLILASIISLFPFLWMLMGMTNTSSDILKGKFGFGSMLMDNIHKLQGMTHLGAAFYNSTIIAVVGTIITLFLSSMAGYGFEIYHSKAKSRLFGLLMLSMMMPFAAVMIPLFRMFSNMGLLNTPTAVVLPSITTAFMIFFFLQNTKSFPRELLQAGRVDGLNEWRLFTLIYVPTMKPTYAAAAIITFMNYWNSFLWPLIALQTQDKKTLPLVVSSLASSYNPDYGIIMVAIVVTTLPSVVIFFLLQKQFVQGMLGSVK